MKFSGTIIYQLLLFILVASAIGCKPKPPFWDEIQNFKKKDKENPPPENAILFVGSSTFRRWTELETVFKEYKAINRGFGGANLLDLNYYAKDIILPYKVRQIIIYCGDNDLPPDTVDAKMLLHRFVNVFQSIRKNKPQVPIAYISIKPSPARKKYLPIVKEANTLIRDYLNTQPHTDFIDVFTPMLTSEGKYRPELYVEDNLHMKPEAYDIWVKAITPHLIKE